ncbi:MAG TPA: MBL fold metallo-hydrolase [Candidatus Rifleibacterium sp.]|nr:MBL fold metallo-hydrolase [Candidatus Rifleibacterium sp.]
MRPAYRSLWLICCIFICLAVVPLPVASFAAKIKNPEPETTVSEAWQPGTLEIRFFNVGKGDATLLRLPDGRFAMIDTGYAETAPGLIKKLKRLGVGKIDLLVITHHHKDHVGGYPYLLEAFPVTKVIQAYDPRQKDKNLVAPGTLLLHDRNLTLRAVGPVRNHADENDASLVTRLEFGRVAILFAADAVEEAMADMLKLKDKKKLRADLLKVPHHGRYRGFSPRDFFTAVKPEFAIITSDEKAGDPPEGSVIRILKESGARVLLTDELGDIQFLSDGETLDYIPGGKK